MQVKETCKHGSGTQRTFVKIFALVLRALFQQNVLLFTPAARVSFAASDAFEKIYVFLPNSLCRAAKGGRSKRERLGAFLPPLFGARQEAATKPHSERVPQAQCERG